MQPPLYVPAGAGWFPRPGDPPNHLRYWDGRQWLCDVRGAERDHFNHLRSLPPEARSPQDEELLRWLTAEVSRIEDLVLSDPRANPPLVERPQVALSAPPADPYAGHAPAWSGSPAYPTAPSRAARPYRSLPPRSGGLLGKGVAGVVVVVLFFVGRFALGFFASTASEATVLKVGACITISYPATGTAADDLTYNAATCVTKPGGKVSYTIVAKSAGKAACDADADSFHTYFSDKNSVAYTYCLMANLAKGECLYIDSKGFAFDVACTDSTAMLKITTVENKGTGVACAATEKAIAYPSNNRTYCLSVLS